jgi:hypothetical protein
MTLCSEREERGNRRGMSRRELIRNAAGAGVVAWTAPLLIESIASPSASLSDGFPCSYASIVYTVNGSGPFAAKINQFTSTCDTSDNSTSSDAPGFSNACGGHTYSNGCSGNKMCQDGSAVPAGGGSCPFTVSGGHVTANAGVSILFAAIHNGSCTNHFCAPICGPTTSFTTTCSN